MTLSIDTVIVCVAATLCAIVDATGGPNCADGTTTVTPTASTSGDDSAFGVGGEDSEYADSLDQCWQIQASAADTSAVTITFDFFHIENSHDHVTIWSGESEVAMLTGEVVTPHAVRVTDLSETLVVEFYSDGTFHSDPTTLQLGFSASVFDSSGGECVNDCSGNGNCSNGTCACDAEFAGADCSVSVTILEPGVTHVVQDLPVGGWSYFAAEYDSAIHYLVEVIDWGQADSDVLLLIDKSGTELPTLSSSNTVTDWLDWYYDRNDIAYVRAYASAGDRIYIGVTNDRLRATGQLDFNVTMRSSETGWPCIDDCSNHGTCVPSTGMCHCDEGWEPLHLNSPSTCEFKIEPLEFDETLAGYVRIGDWDYYQVDIDDRIQQDDRTLLVQFYSESPHSYPIVLLRKGQVPRLEEQFVPTFKAFDADFGDEEGFELLQGQRQAIIVNATYLTEGSWYIGVFNIWGNNVVDPFVSHDECSYSLFVNLYAAGTPCPRADSHFCDGYECDFNEGVCDCPADRLWEDCSFETTTLTDEQSVEGTLAVDETAYFYVLVDDAALAQGANLVVSLERPEGQDAQPYLLARLDDIPFPEDIEHYDEHDLLSNFYGDAVHTIVLDATELTAGNWYIAVMNSEASTTDLTYTLSIDFTDSVDCSLTNAHADDTAECSGLGTCDYSLGRCDCPDGSTFDDCSADGVFHIDNGESTATMAYPEGVDPTPDIPVDDWGFWSVAVGCEGLTFRVHFKSTNDGSAPYLVVRKGELPLMIMGTNDYWDYYSGDMTHAKEQAIEVDDCPNVDKCIIHSAYPGTRFSTGYPEPGVYYVGVYNDKDIAHDPITDYVVDFELTGSCASDACGEGFVGDSCEVMCPGMAATDVYTNAPASSQSACTGHGTCSLDASGTTASCACVDGYYGDDCSEACPGLTDSGAEACSGRGTCGMEGSALTCSCDSGYAGADCALECPGGAASPCQSSGQCVAADGADSATCTCDSGFEGDECQFECPGGSSSICSGNGVCATVSGWDGSAVEARCTCDAGYWDTDCSKQTCPGVIDDDVDGDGVSDAPNGCSGSGECKSGAVCECYSGFGGSDCLMAVEEGKKHFNWTLLLILSSSIGGLALIAGIMYVVIRRQRNVIHRYEQIHHNLTGGERDNVNLMVEAVNSQTSSGGASRSATAELGMSPFHSQDTKL